MSGCVGVSPGQVWAKTRADPRQVSMAMSAEFDKEFDDTEIPTRSLASVQNGFALRRRFIDVIRLQWA